MTRYISVEIRLAVANRALNLCEYCLIHAEDTYFGCEVDHIISLKHGGNSDFANLSLACIPCNRFKGTDLTTLLGNRIVPLFNPRRELWKDNFRLNGVRIESRSEIGEATARLLRLNDPSRLIEREFLRTIGRYPSSVATLISGAL